MNRTCGDCSMCCHILDVPDLAKPAHQWCSHISPDGGCGIYGTRFEICRGYRCGWLMDESLGPEWQPSVSGFIFHKAAGALGLWINVDLADPESWKREPYYSTIKIWSQAARLGNGYVAVNVGNSVFIVFPEEDLEIPDFEHGADLKVGYRATGIAVRPLVMIRNSAGQIVEHLGAAQLRPSENLA